MNVVYCPFCPSSKPMSKAGKRGYREGKVEQHYICEDCLQQTTAPLGPYQIIGKLSLSLLGFRIVRVNGFDGFTDRFTATSKEEAIEIASEMLASGRYESVVYQNRKGVGEL